MDPTECLILRCAQNYLGLAKAQSLVHQRIAKGASGRTILRITLPDTLSIIGIHNDHSRPENASFIPLSKWLSEHSIPIAQLLHHDGEVALVEDLGETDLLDLLAQPWPARRFYYHRALDALLKFHQLPTEPPFQLHRAFDFAAYQWEQEYFAQFCLHQHLNLKLPKLLPTLEPIARELGAATPVMVHRDFQSQNIMVRNQAAFLIDYQGMRPGHAEYDLASLVYDAYSRLRTVEQKELISYWISIGGTFSRERFLQCALQRLMQALGAFANIAHNLGNPWYFQHIPTALDALLKVAAELGMSQVFAPLKAALDPASMVEFDAPAR